MAALVEVREGYVGSADGVRLYYRLVGDAADPVVVLHGGPGFSMRYLEDDLAPLAQERSVLFYDQRGTGRSTLVDSAPALDAVRFAEDLEAVRRHFGLEHLVLLGHSWGAGVAALYATRYPQRIARLIVVGGMPLRRAEFDRTFQRLDASRKTEARQRLQRRRDAWLSNPASVRACRRYYEAYFRPFFGRPEVLDASKADFCAGSPGALRNKIECVDRYTVASLGDWDWRPALRALAAPALIVHGTADVIPLGSAREWATALPNSGLLALDGVGHFPYVEVPELFFPAVGAFLAGRWPEGTDRSGRVEDR
ncbi:MAG TPA: alpha/beta fold hydrolase [Burkholderiaceae bacterium]|nr:alpha/beta fold hydrolase [Burkholderiaceae bacterium]